MSGEIPLYDLMSIEALVISRAWSDFRVAGVNTLISQLEAGASPLSTHELKYDGDHLIIGGFQRHLMEVILWAAYIYCLFRSELDKDNINAKRASQLLHELFVQKAGDPESDIEGHFLMEHLNQTMVTFAKNLPTKHRPSENKKSPDSKDDSTAELQSRIAELEAELKKTKEENAQLKEQIKNSDDYLPELDEVQKMTLHQKIVFFTTVTSVLLDKRYTNMRNLASFIASMCNEKPSTIAPMLSRIGQISDDNPNPNLSATLHSAAQCVSDLLLQILTDETRNDKSQIINKIRENLLLNYPSPEDE